MKFVMKLTGIVVVHLTEEIPGIANMIILKPLAMEQQVYQMVVALVEGIIHQVMGMEEVVVLEIQHLQMTEQLHLQEKKIFVNRYLIWLMPLLEQKWSIYYLKLIWKRK